MADQDRPNQNANKSKAEGERWSPEEGRTGKHADRDESPEQLYNADDDSDNAGGITNRPLSDEIRKQQDLPERGTTRDTTGDPNATTPEGDYAERDR